MNKGQIQLEALISFIIFLAIVSSFLSLLSNQAVKAGEAGNHFAAKMGVQKCAIIIDALYSNGGGKIIGLDANCTVEGKNQIKSKHGRAEKSAFAFPPRVKLIQSNNQTILEVGVNEHYR